MGYVRIHVQTRFTDVNVLIKADDLRLIPLTGAWERFLSFCETEKVHANIGVICEWPRGQKDESRPRDEVAREALAMVNIGAGVTIWNHGLDHSRDKAAGISDFRGTPLALQIRSLRIAQERVEDLTGVRMQGFGAPFNWWDQDTIVALQQLPELQYVFHIPFVPGKTCYGSELFVEAEPFKGKVKPGAKRTFSNENAKKKSDRFLNLGRNFVLQVHPNSWDNEALDNFSDYVNFLRSADVTFAAMGNEESG